MKKIKLLLVAFLYVATSLAVSAQKYKVEQSIIDCASKNQKIQDISFKESIAAHEQLLISEKLLKDGFGSSYLMALNRFITDKDFNYAPSKGFSFPDLNKCKFKFVNTNATKINKIDAIKDSIIKSELLTPYNFAKRYLKLLSEKDLEQDYYKLQVFQLFQLLDIKSIKDALFSELNAKLINKDSVNLINALIVSIDAKNQLSVNNKRVSLDSLKNEVRAYLSEYGAWAIFVLESSPNTVYGQYKKMTTTLLNEVLVLRKQLAFEKYNKEYDCLTKEKKAVIERQYPIVIVEY